MRPFVDAPAAPWSPQHEARLTRLRLLSRVLDAQWSIPGTRYRVGLDGLVGLMPGVGDAAGALLSTYILYEPMVLVSYTPYNHISLLQAKFRYRERHETRRVGP